MRHVSTLLTVPEAAVLLSKKRNRKVSESAVWRMVYAKKNPLPSFRVGRNLWIPNLEQWLAEQSEKANATQRLKEQTSGAHAKRVRAKAATSKLAPPRGRKVVYLFGTPERVVAAGGR